MLHAAFSSHSKHKALPRHQPNDEHTLAPLHSELSIQLCWSPFGFFSTIWHFLRYSDFSGLTGSKRLYIESKSESSKFVVLLVSADIFYFLPSKSSRIVDKLQKMARREDNIAKPIGYLIHLFLELLRLMPSDDLTKLSSFYLKIYIFGNFEPTFFTGTSRQWSVWALSADSPSITDYTSPVLRILSV